MTAPRLHPHRSALLTPALAVGMAAVLAGCGSGGGSSTGTTTPVSAPSTGTRQAPGVSGQTAAISGTTLQVQNSTQGQVAVSYTASTRITEEKKTSLAAATVGDCVTATGAPSGGGVQATSVVITTPVSGTCLQTGAGGEAGGFGGGRGFTGGGFAGASGSPTGRPSASPGATPRSFAFATGTVTAVSPTSITLSGFLRDAVRTAGPRPTGTASATTATPSATRVSVSVGAATTFTTVVTVKGSALAVGQCVTALGPSNDIGTVTATSIAIRPAGPNGCEVGRGFGRPGAPSGSSTRG